MGGKGVLMNDEVLLLGGNKGCGMPVEDAKVSGIWYNSHWEGFDRDPWQCGNSEREIILEGQLRVQCNGESIGVGSWYRDEEVHCGCVFVTRGVTDGCGQVVLQGSDNKHQWTIESQFRANLIAFTTYLTIGIVIDSLASTFVFFPGHSPLLY